MQFITTWKVRPGKLAEAVDRFLGTGDPMPDGVKSVGRWHRSDMQGGVHIVEAENPRALAEYTARWADLLEIETAVGLGDAEASIAYAQIPGVTVKAKSAGARGR
jgi:hypothetical protein